jgi:hypothetical protein
VNGLLNWRAGFFGGGASTGCALSGFTLDEEETGRGVGSPDRSRLIKLVDRLRAIGGGAVSSSSSSESSNTNVRNSRVFCASRAALGERRMAGGSASSTSIAALG